MNPFHFGAIFDWDGVMIDSSKHHELSWIALSQETGRPLPDGFFKKSFGMKNTKIIPEILNWVKDPLEVKSLSDRKEELYREIIRERGISALPGSVEWVQTLHRHQIPCVVGSSTDRQNIELCLQLLGLKNCFTEIVSAEDVKQGKPHPDVFLKAAQKINLLPSECIVFEDAHVGIEAARKAKIKVIALTTTHPRSSLSDADHILSHLGEMNFEIARTVLQK